VERLAIALQASLLLRAAPGFVADAWCASRLGESARLFGALPARSDFSAILARALPA
jgi:putative acyl-CoA dehydrogenase